MEDTQVNKFTEEDVLSCWPYHSLYLAQVLNGEYSLNEAREDLRSLVSSKYDLRRN